MRRYGFIYNPRSGDGKRRTLLRDAAEKLRVQGMQVTEYLGERDPGEPARQAIREGCDVIVACGGDGTVNAVAGALYQAGPNHGVIMGVLPLGTLNHFAKDLGVTGMADAERTLAEGHVKEVDAGLVNGRLFVNNSGIGVYPMMVLEREKVQQAGLPKWPAFVIACAKTLFRLPFQLLHLDADGVHLARSTPFLFVGNNVYTMGGMALGRRRCLDEGVLEVCVATRVGPFGLLRMAIRALFGTLREDRDFTALASRQVSVRRRRDRLVHVSVDGEVCRMRSPLEYTIAPRALRVLAPN